MFKSLTSAFALSLALLGSGALAQDSTTPPADGTGTGTETSDSGLDLGQPVTEGPQLGERYAKETFGDWTLACVKTNEETDPCSLLQVLYDEKGTAMAEMSLFRLAGEGKAVAGGTIIVPLETLLPAQLTITIDGGLGKRYNYTYCGPLGCVVQIGITEEDITALKKGNSATISLVPAPTPDQTFELTLSLKGFTAGYDKVDIVQK